MSDNPKWWEVRRRLKYHLTSHNHGRTLAILFPVHCFKKAVGLGKNKTDHGRRWKKGAQFVGQRALISPTLNIFLGGVPLLIHFGIGAMRR